MIQLPASYSLPNPFPTGIKEEPTSIPFHPSQAPRSTCQNFAPECAFNGASKVVLVLKNLLAKAGDLGDAGLIHGLGDPLEESMATHSSILVWKIPWREEPGKLQSIGSQRVGHD